MKAKKLLVFLLALVFVLTLALVACTPEEEKPGEQTKTDAAVNVTSALTPTIEVGQVYTLVYTSNDTVTVTASGGNYDQATQKFSASTAGTYTLTVKASGENKNDKVVTVTITVTASNVDRTALAAAIEAAANYIESDYNTASWRAFELALEDAEEANETAGKTQAQIDEAKTALDEAISNLVPAAITKATVNTGKTEIAYNGNTYTDIEYSNLEDIADEIEALNANAEVTLKSQYASAIETILAKLEARIIVTIEELSNDAAMVVSALRDWNLHITATESATIVVKVGEAADTEKEYFVTLTAEEDGTYAIAKEMLDWDTEYVIEVTASKEGKETVTIERHVKFIRAGYVANVNGASVTDDVLKVTENYNWDDHMGRKIVPEGLQLIGEFTVTFDLKFTEGFGGAQVMAMFLLREDNGQVLNHWIAIRHQDNKMELAYDNYKPTVDMPAGTVNIDNTMRFRLTRTINEQGESQLKGELIDIATGKVLATNDNGGAMKYSEIVTLGFQSEHVAWEVTNITIGMNDKARNVAALRTAMIGYEILNSGNYTDATWNIAKAAYEDAVAALNDKTKTQSDVDNIAKTLNDAVNALETKSVENLYTIETEEETVVSITYNEKTYTSAIYTNINEIAAELEAIDDELPYVEYVAKIEEALAKLESALAITINTNLRENILIETLTEKSIAVNTTLNKEEITEGVTYEWTVNGEVVSDQTGATYTWTPVFGTKYTISVIARYTKDDETIESNDLEVVCSFVEAHPYIPQDFVNNRNAKFENGVYTIGTGAPWGNWEGRKLVFDEIVFNGSFEITLDFKVVQFEGPGVITIHFLNADTLSLRDQRDPALSGYACVNINASELETANAKRTERHDWIANNLKTNGVVARMTATFKKQTNNDITITVTLTYVANDGTVYSDSFTSDQVLHGLEHGMYVGLNIENTSFEVSNISYKLIEEAGLITGSITNKSALRAAIAAGEEALVDSDKYFLDGVNNLQAVLQLARRADNGEYAENYNEIIAAINEAIEGLKEKDFDVIITGMDYTHYTTAPEAITASLPEGVEGADTATIKWSYKLNDAEEATIVNGATLENLEEGVYNELTVIVTIDGEEIKFLQPTLTIAPVVLKSNREQVVVNETKDVATVNGGAGWDPKDQLVIEGVWATEFDLVFDIKQTSEHDGGFRVACLNLFGTDARLVLGYQREGQGGRLHSGFDNKGNDSMIAVRQSENADDYNAVYGPNATAQFKANVKIAENGKVLITFTIAVGDNVIITDTCELDKAGSTTELRFTFENVNVELSNFELMYK